VFIGLGLHGEHGLTLEGLEQARQADMVYIETYTNLMPGLSLKRLEELFGKSISELSREDLEDNPDKSILENAKGLTVALAVPGDPMVATTHVDLRLRAKKVGIETDVVNGTSIYSAAPAASGLQIYKFGKTVTIPYTSPIYKPVTPYNVIRENQARNLHTLILLDIDAEKKRYMTVREGLRYLLETEKSSNENVVMLDTLAVGVAGLGSSTPLVKADRVGRLLDVDFGVLPHTLIFPAGLHFMEAEALRAFAGAPEKLLRVD